MYNDQGDVEMLRSFVRKYNKWVQDVRNPVYENGGEDWHKVSQALSDLSALRKIAKNLKAFEDINLHDGEKVTITIKRLDGTTQNLDGDWLVRVAELEEEKGEAN
jgi:predicted DNA-binding antitoxin AbrB/MazE fold protein